MHLSDSSRFSCHALDSSSIISAPLPNDAKILTERRVRPQIIQQAILTTLSDGWVGGNHQPRNITTSPTLLRIGH
jgi:hypothetical protein